ncbi:MAG: ABC transporter permease, partial [Prevotella sp.]|nr:ABC transporter permease [Prevotella sp.]
MKLFLYFIAPVFVIVFFTSLMNEGLPTELPVGVVDLDNSSTTRNLIRRVDAFQSTSVKKVYRSEAEALAALEKCEIYGYIVLPEGLSSKVISSRQPTINIYYNSAFFTAGTLAYKDLRIIATLAKAAVGQAKLQAMGATDQQIETFLQPVVLDAHMIGNPWTNYNAYLSTMIIPGLIIMFAGMMTIYTLGSELREGTARESLRKNRNSILLLLLKKLLPITLIYSLIMLCCQVYFYVYLGFPHEGSWAVIIFLTVLMVLAAQGGALFLFGIIPHFRLSLSICSLWSVLNFSMSGTAYPVASMDPILQALSYLFPLRHYFMAFQLSIF